MGKEQCKREEEQVGRTDSVVGEELEGIAESGGGGGGGRVWYSP
jgi:hypothetical protein